MKPLLAVVLFVNLIGSLGLLLGLSAQTANVEQTLIQTERDWAQALAKSDDAALNRILAADWMITNEDGELLTKAQSDARRKSGAVKYASFTEDDFKVRVFGDKAIVTGRSTVEGTQNGKDISGQYRFTDAFVRRDGRWQAVSTHVSRVAAEPVQSDRASDEVAIRAQTAAYEDAVNRRDADAIANLFATDGDLIVYDGPRLIGRDAIRQSMQTRWAELPATMRIAIKVMSIRFLKPDLAIVETVATFNEGDVRENRGTAVMVREGGNWLDAALRVFAAEKK